MFRVFRSDWFNSKLDKLPKADQERVHRFEKQLKKQAYLGKPLGYPFLREKKFNGRRAIFLVYAEQHVVYMVTISKKKTQKAEIEVIKQQFALYEKEVKRMLRTRLL
tara:strand:+ start:239 stop:559 length:321 start_codon:yes stop_codon:yes gene_type:complete